MQSNNANAIAASLCESSENVLKNEKTSEKRFWILPANYDLLHEKLIAKTYFIKSTLDIQATCLATVLKCSPRHQTSGSRTKLQFTIPCVQGKEEIG